LPPDQQAKARAFAKEAGKVEQQNVEKTSSYRMFYYKLLKSNVCGNSSKEVFYFDYETALRHYSIVVNCSD
jgi:hypothetical protein